MLPFAISSIDLPDKKEFYTRLYRAYYPAMARQAYQVTGSQRDVEDIIQDALVRLLRQYDKLRTLSEAHLAFYTVLTVKTTAIDLLRKRRRDSEWSYYGAAEDIAPDVPDTHTPQQVLERGERNTSLYQAVDKLPEAKRDLILYKYVLGKSNHELAALFGTSEANIWQMLSRARRKLCAILEDLE